MANNIKLKLNEIRQVSLPKEEISFSEFVTLAQKIYGDILHPESDHLFKYEDQDGDVVTITNSSDLNLALRSCKVLQVTPLFVRKERGSGSRNDLSEGCELNENDEIKLQLKSEIAKRVNFEEECRRLKEEKEELMMKLKQCEVVKKCQDKMILKLQHNNANSLISVDDSSASFGAIRSSLDDDCILHIFRFLPIRALIQFEIVCKKWKNLVQIYFQDMFTEKKLSVGKFIEYCRNSIGRGDVIVINKIIKLIGNKIVNVDEKLYEFLEPNMTYETASVIGRYCPNLENMYFSGKVDDIFCLTTIIDWCRKIRTLSIDFSPSENDCHELEETLKWILVQLNVNLIELELKGVVRNVPREFLSVLPKTLQKLDCEWKIHTGPLELFKSSNFQVLKLQDSLSTKVLNCITINCPSIIELSVNIVHDGDEDCLCSKVNFSNLINLKIISLDMDNDVPLTFPDMCRDKLLNSLLNCKKLEKIIYTNHSTNWQWLLKIITQCKSLKEVYVPCFFPLQYVGFEMFVEAIKAHISPIKIMSCQRLSDVHLLILKSLNCDYVNTAYEFDLDI